MNAYATPDACTLDVLDADLPLPPCEVSETSLSDDPKERGAGGRELQAEGQETIPLTRTMTATYSPDDNKLRLYSVQRLDRDLYARVRAAGFIFAPKQDLFVAPMWTPERADLLLELCGEIDDEDTSLVERAEERGDRFEDYSQRRAADAQGARAAVARITDSIPLGQPILVGHHSERRARRDAKRIENGMRRAVKLWSTSKYWTARAAGALRHAKYKELPGVRHRRIKQLEADKRRHERTLGESRTFAKLWGREGLTREGAMKIANFDRVNLPPANGETSGRSLWSALDKNEITVAAAVAQALESHAIITKRASRWVEHLELRLAYERAMLGDVGRLAADRFDIEAGGRVLVGREWLVVLRVNRKAGRVQSVTTNDAFCRLKSVGEIADYRGPEGDDAAKVATARRLPPFVNYPGEGFQHT